mmetsp:Transcript_111863/g.256472  ORF Transcript_111863/g.256472 Transcript_111863/m.256472 type:complete len:155 (-) Transcript_111863:115-579(-)
MCRRESETSDVPDDWQRIAMEETRAARGQSGIEDIEQSQLSDLAGYQVIRNMRSNVGRLQNAVEKQVLHAEEHVDAAFQEASAHIAAEIRSLRVTVHSQMRDVEEQFDTGITSLESEVAVSQSEVKAGFNAIFARLDQLHSPGSPVGILSPAMM